MLLWRNNCWESFRPTSTRLSMSLWTACVLKQLLLNTVEVDNTNFDSFTYIYKEQAHVYVYMVTFTLSVPRDWSLPKLDFRPNEPSFPCFPPPILLNTLNFWPRKKTQISYCLSQNILQRQHINSQYIQDPNYSLFWTLISILDCNVFFLVYN